MAVNSSLENSCEFITDKEIFKQLMTILGCEKTVGVKWHKWDSTPIYNRFPERGSREKKPYVFDEETVSILCSMLCIALDQDFGEELFVNVNGRQDYNINPEDPDNNLDSDDKLSYGERIVILKELLRNINEMSKPATNDDTIRAYNGIAEYINSLDKSCNQGNLIYYYPFYGIIQFFVYVYYIHLLLGQYRTKLVD